MKKIYAMPTTHCNLSCDHCYIKNSPEEYKRDLFLHQLRSFDGQVVLFGGEPTIYMDRFKDAIDSGSVNTVSTNLLHVDKEIMNLLKKVGSLSTSWNPHRFKDIEYQQWLNNIDHLIDYDLRTSILITLTNDLLEIHPVNFMKIIKDWNSNAIRYIAFEHYVGNTDKEYFDRADQWLCDIYTQWNSPIRNQILEKINHWFHNCDDIYTLFPDGQMVLGCPHQSKIYVPDECLLCGISTKCRPCKLQNHCSYPKHLAKLINEGCEMQSNDIFKNCR